MLPALRPRQRHDNASFRLTERRPSLHESAPLLKRVAASIGPLSFIAHDVRERRFGDLTRSSASLKSLPTIVWSRLTDFDRNLSKQVEVLIFECHTFPFAFSPASPRVIRSNWRR